MEVVNLTQVDRHVTESSHSFTIINFSQLDTSSPVKFSPVVMFDIDSKW
jgi:hypothetical protein